MREPARGAAHAAAHIEHAVMRGDSRALREDLDRLDSAVVILVEVLELLLRQRLEVGPARLQLREDFVLVDRMGVVETHDAGFLIVEHALMRRLS
jgi:hypothetical protein